MRVLGLPIVAPDVVVNRALSDLSALARAARRAPEQLDRLLSLGEELVAIGHAVLELGERIDARAEELLELGGQMREIGRQVDHRGAELVARAGQVAQTGTELVAVIPTLERAIEMTTPLEGAIDRVGRLVDRLPGGVARRRPDPFEADPSGPTAPPDPLTDRPAPPDVAERGQS